MPVKTNKLDAVCNRANGTKQHFRFLCFLFLATLITAPSFTSNPTIFDVPNSNIARDFSTYIHYKIIMSAAFNRYITKNKGYVHHAPFGGASLKCMQKHLYR